MKASAESSKPSTTAFSREDAALMVFAELVAGEARDLSDALLATGGVDALLKGSYDHLTPRAAFIEYLRSNLTAARMDFWTERLQQLHAEHPDVRIVTIQDAQYPDNLRNVFGAPPFLYIKGNYEAEDRIGLAIVGSRSAGNQGREAAFEIARSVSVAGVTVVSGLARGIDAAAHAGALDQGGRTIAVLGHGIDSIYPPENRPLAERVIGHGCLISQFRPGSPPTKSTFPIRNAVISGLALASLVVEAQERSGARSEADHALRQRSPVLLWRPLLGSASWAQRFAEHPGVSFVSCAEEILQIVSSHKS